MIITKGSPLMNRANRWLILIINVALLLFINSYSLQAATLNMSNIAVNTLDNNKVQIELEMSGSAAIPKIFHTDSPARIALDFSAVKNGLNKKMLPINQGGVTSIYLAEVSDKMRVIINLVESLPFETKVMGNKVLLILSAKNIAPLAPIAAMPITVPTATPAVTTTPPIAEPVAKISNDVVAPVTQHVINSLPTKNEVLALSDIHVDSLAGDKLQIQLDMNAPAIKPQVFRTDNPARITFDFPAIKNNLNKKIIPVGQGALNSIYIVEAGNRTRIIVNLLESVPFDTKTVDNKVLITLNGTSVISPAIAKTVEKTPAFNIGSAKSPVLNNTTTKNYALATKLMPEQAINGFDFKRGDNGEGRLLVSLASANTIVNSKEQSGKIILSFLNTRLPEQLSKRLDFSEFATPVKFIEATSSNKETTVTITTQDKLYDYSLFQSDGLLTVEFRPITLQEKEVMDKSRTKYTGERLSLNFQDIEIRSVIAILAEFTGQNVVAGDDVLGTITLKLDDVPWDEALDFVMMTKGLGKFETGNVTLISPLDKIKDYKKKQQETEAVVAQLDPLITEYIKVSYAKAIDLKNLLMGLDTGAFGSCGNTQIKSRVSTSSVTSSSTPSPAPAPASTKAASNTNSSSQDQETFGQLNLLSRRGSLFVDSRTNTLIVHETAKQLDEIKKLIRKLDVPVRQVMIEARVVNATDSFTKAIGVKFGGAKIANVGSGNSFGMGASGTQGSQGAADVKGEKVEAASGVFFPSSSDKVPNNTLVDLGLTAAQLSSGGALAMTLARGADYVLNLELQAAQTQGAVEVLANPRVMTADRCIATIKQGIQIPYVSVTNSGGNITSTTVFQNADLQLDVLPQITPNGNVIMSLRISNDTKGDLLTTGQYTINTEELQTNVQVLNGETVVLGGVFGQSKNDSTAKVPFFSDLPGIGFLFKRTNKIDEKKELLIFITPKIVKDELSMDGS